MERETSDARNACWSAWSRCFSARLYLQLSEGFFGMLHVLCNCELQISTIRDSSCHSKFLCRMERIGTSAMSQATVVRSW